MVWVATIVMDVTQAFHDRNSKPVDGIPHGFFLLKFDNNISYGHTQQNT